MLLKTALLGALVVNVLQAQIQQFPYIENFDTVTAPALPAGWITTTNRTPTGDFTTTTSSVFSPPNAVLSTNATISQSLITPILNFSSKEADSIFFYERRSATHNSGVLLEASTDGGTTFTLQIGDTLKNPGTTSYIQRRLNLPLSLNNQPSVKIRWRVVGNGTGTSGTFRIDNVRITAIAQVDGGVTAIHFFPAFPVIGDSVFIRATVKNFGTQPIQKIPVEFYDDANNDSTPDPPELMATVTLSQLLQPNDTAVVSLQLFNLRYGERTIIARTAIANDQQLLNDVSLSVLSIGFPVRSIVVNEIMYAPQSPAPEWIELTNNYPDPINLKRWSISDNNIARKHIITSSDIWLHFGEFIVITKDSIDFTQVYPEVTNVIFVPSMPTSYFGNTGDAVVIFDNRGAMMDSVSYSPRWGGTGGKSLERIEPSENSNDSTNWGTSGDSAGSTPGRHNFLTPLEHDIKALRLSATTTPPGTPMTIAVIVQNVGRQPVSEFSVSLYKNANRDSIIQQSELLQNQTIIITIQPKDSLAVNFVWDNPPSGQFLLITTIEYPLDNRTANNIVYGIVNIAFQRSSLVINEILYDPPRGFTEYVEMYNAGKTSINVFNWKLNTFKISRVSRLISPGQYLIVAADTSIFERFPHLTDTSYNVVVLNRSSLGLNNDGDDVVLTDLTEHMIDSLHYLPTWHNPEIEDVSGRSLERINPWLPTADARNWSTCTDASGGTPGKQNSIFAISMPSGAALSFSPNPFSPDGDGFEDHTIISYQVPTTVALIRVRIFDSKGRLVRTLANNEPSGSNGQLIWDGFSDSREKVRIGIYIVLLESLDTIGREIQKAKGVVVVAAKL